MGPAERADVIVDFTDVPVGSERTLRQPRARRAVRRRRARRRTSTRPIPRRPARSCSSAWSQRVARRPHDAAAVPARCRAITAAAGRRPHAPAGAASRMTSDVLDDGPAEAHARHVVDRTMRHAGMTLRCGRTRHREPGRRRHRGVGDLQLHRGRAPDPHPRGHVRGRQPPGARLDEDGETSPGTARGDARLPEPGRPASRTPSSPTRARSPASG